MKTDSDTPFGWTILCGIRWSPVSYTHLDVYKRQDNDPEKIEVLKRVLSLFPKKQQIQVFASRLDVNEYLDRICQDLDLAKKMFMHGATTILYVDPFDFGTVEIPKVSAVLQKHYCEPVSYTHLEVYKRKVPKWLL